MKKVSGIILLMLAFLHYGCQKSSASADLPEVNAHLSLAAPAADGPGVDQLIVDGTGELVIPINKTGAWPKNDDVAMAIRFVDTGKRVNIAVGGHVVQRRVVYLVTFREL